MKKLLFIIISLLIVILVAFVFYNIYKKTMTVTSPTPSQTPSLSTGDLTAPGKIAIPTNDGNVIINDPYKKSLKTVSDNANLTDNSDYDIVYLGSLKSFVITIFGKNLNDSRRQAEQIFLDSLGISKEDACKLTVSLSVDKSANENAAGKNYGLSFCSNGKPFLDQ